MCGISGVLSFGLTGSAALGDVVRMCNAMRARGPDDEGYFASDGNTSISWFYGPDTPNVVRAQHPEMKNIDGASSSKFRLVMGHRRLSILDLSPAGHQPMGYERGLSVIVFNGEIYNFKEIRARLRSMGYRFRTNTDTEVMLASYAEWGEDALKQVNGDFAFAIWDENEKILFCARDRLGVKPFYFSTVNERFLFGSDIKSMLASGLIKAEVNPVGLYQSMVFGISPRPLTAFESIEALEPGHCMRVHIGGRIEKKRFWTVPLCKQKRAMNLDDAVEGLDWHINAAVSKRLLADVPVGTFMSGGVDSTLITAIAAIHQPGIKALTLGYESDETALDEVDEARAAASLMDVDHRIHRVRADALLGGLKARILGYEEPHYALAANLVMSEFANSQGVKVVLNGLGGDELFAGYSYYKYAGTPTIPGLWALNGFFEKVLSGSYLRAFQAFSRRTPDALHTRLFMKASDAEIASLFRKGLLPPINTPELISSMYAQGLSFEDDIEALSYMDLLNYVGNHHLHRTDQFSMMNSVEGRFPLLDHELVEFAFSIPSCLKIKRGQQKIVLKEVAKKYVHDKNLAMKKKGFSLPIASWMRGPLRETVLSKLDRLKRRPDIREETVVKWYAAYLKGALPARRIWHLVALEMWYEIFIDADLWSE